MKRTIYFWIFFLPMLSGLFSCEDLTDLNKNPNGIDPQVVNANLILSTVTTETPKLYLSLGYGNASGVVQHTQKDAWFTEHNDYDWSNIDWTDYYYLLVNIKFLHDLAVEDKLEFQQGVALVLKSFLFGQVTDLWGDAPYSQALQGDGKYTLPVYDSQEAIYTSIINDLKTASTLLSKNADEYTEIYADADAIYDGDPSKWRKLANSLLLRYYMRISNKVDVQADFMNVVNNDPIFTSNSDDATLQFYGNTEEDAWPNSIDFDASGSNFRRKRPCSTLVEQLRSTNDPRIGVWFARVAIPTVLSTTMEHNVIVDGIRYLNPDYVDVSSINTNTDYVGLPPGLPIPSAYNNNPTPGQTSLNDFVSYLADMYKHSSGTLLKARMMSYSEVCFLLAEAANKGWMTGEQTYYEKGIQASLETWGVGSQYESFITQAGVAFDGTLKQLITQKWIAAWTMAQEAWYDWRRTGYPELKSGPSSLRTVLPLRFPYGNNEINFNTGNCSSAIDQLQLTNYSQEQGNSPWSKSWLLMDTNKPY